MANRMIQPFVLVGLKIVEKMEIVDKKGQGLVMRFAKIYKPEKLGKIIEVAQNFVWWQSNPTAAFLKAVGVVNKQEKDEKPTA